MSRRAVEKKVEDLDTPRETNRQRARRFAEVYRTRCREDFNKEPRHRQRPEVRAARLEANKDRHLREVMLSRMRVLKEWAARQTRGEE